MAYDKERAIAAQNAASAAASLLQGTGASVELFEQYRNAIFDGTVKLAGIAPESVAQVASVFPGAQVENVQQPAPQQASSNGDSGAGVEIRFGKYRGKTIAQVHAEDPEYVEWLAESSNNAFVKSKAREFLSSLAAA